MADAPWHDIHMDREDLSPHRRLLLERAKKARVALEIGTSRGNSTRILAAGAAHVWTVDIAEPDHAWPARHPVPNVTFLHGDSLTVAWDQAIDLLFIDGDHAYAHVKHELKRFGPWVRKGGCILLHDVTQSGTPYPNGVMKAMHEWCKEVRLVYTVHPGGHGMGDIEVTYDLDRQ